MAGWVFPVEVTEVAPDDEGRVRWRLCVEQISTGETGCFDLYPPSNSPDPSGHASIALWIVQRLESEHPPHDERAYLRELQDAAPIRFR
jgi:hypothetical protein